MRIVSEFTLKMRVKLIKKRGAKQQKNFKDTHLKENGEKCHFYVVTITVTTATTVVVSIIIIVVIVITIL